MPCKVVYLPVLPAFVCGFVSPVNIFNKVKYIYGYTFMIFAIFATFVCPVCFFRQRNFTEKGFICKGKNLLLEE